MDQIKVLAVLEREHGVLAVDPAGEQRQAFIAGECAVKGRHSKRKEVICLKQLGADRPASIGGIGRVVGLPAAIAELNEAGVFDPMRLGIPDRKYSAFAVVLAFLESDLNFLAEWAGYSVTQ